MSKTYHIKTMGVAARPRSQKLREAGYYTALTVGKNSSSNGSQTVVEEQSDEYFAPIYDQTQKVSGIKTLYDIYIIQTPADPDANPPVVEVTKDATEILRHLSLQVINPGESNEETVLVSDIAFASLYGITAGGIGVGGGGGTGGGSLSGLADVTLSSPAAGDILRYDDTTSHWVNTPLEVALSGLTDVTISTTPANGQVLTYDSATGKWKPGSASGTAAGALADLSDVAIGSQTDGQALVWNDDLHRWVPGTVGGATTPAWKIYMGTCSTGASTKAKVATTDTFPTDSDGHPLVGTLVWIKFSYTNSASSPTLNVNSTGAYRIWYNTALIGSSNLERAGYASRSFAYIFDGSNWVFFTHGTDINTTYTNKSFGQGYGTCSTAAATVAKTVTMSDYALATGGIVAVAFDNDVPANATMNINSKGAKPMYYRGLPITDGVIKGGDIATFIYSGSYYRLLALNRDFESTPSSINNLFAQIVDSTTQEVTGIEALYDLWIIQQAGSGGGADTLKNIAEILRHLSLQTVNNETILVSDIAFASLYSITAGGIGTAGGDSGGSLAGLADVDVTSRTDGDTLVYNGTTSHWENAPFVLSSLRDVAIGTPGSGQVLMWDSGLGKWRPGTVQGGSGGGGGGIGSITLTMPTGFSVSGSPLTADGTLAVSFASGYSLPLTADVNKGVTAYGWGDHANAGYITEASADNWYGRSLGVYNNRLYLFNYNGSNIGDYVTAGDLKGMLVGSSSATLVTTDDLSGYATQSWVTGKGYITSSALDGYATESWVTNKGYLTSSSLNGYATQTWVGQQGYLTSVPVATDSAYGGIKTGYSPSGDNYAVKLSNGKAYVTVPSYSHPTGGANVTISAATGKVLSAITVNSFGHVTSVASKTLAKADIPSLDYLPITGGTLTGSLTVLGNVSATGNVVAGSASDRRLKKDIRSISLTEAADLLSVLNPVTYQWNEKAGELGGLSGVSRGFLADEYLDVLPNAGRKIWGEYDAIDYNQVIPYLVAGWQQQNLRIRILEGEITTLKEDNELLRRRLRERNVIQ